ncbi:MAG TPA: GntR family transcriptional regulator [Solirubrobacterales bacterium]|jgi:DNA-binding GntR family transcriptional regulator|nr:GntR family transcriptional regulator [Solirubrobacterales bacterium]
MTEPIPIQRARSALAGGESRRGPARIYVYAAIRDAIVRTELAPGARLSENELGQQLGVSRTPVREALGRLRDDRLVEVVPQLGTFVSRISVRAIGEAQFIREALECAAVRQGAELAGDDQITALEQNLAAQKRATESGDIEAWYLLDEAYHHALCDLSGHPTVWSVSERAKSHINRVRRISLTLPDYLPERLAEHGEIVDAIAAHEARPAEETLRHHLRMVLGEVARIRDQHPEYFEEL